MKNSTSGNWATGNLAVGYDGTGELTITNGATVTSDSAFIGLLANSKGTVSLAGSLTAGNNPSWDIKGTNLVVGGSGLGKLLVHNGGDVIVQNANHTGVLTIGDSSSGNGLVRLFSDPTDPDLDFPYTQLIADSIIVGQNGPGKLSLETYAVCFTRRLVIGTNANGGLVVNGRNGKFGDSFASLGIGNNGPLSLGDNSATGTLEITNGGVVFVDGNATMGKNSSLGRAIATISGTNSVWSVAGNLDIGENGPSTIQLNDGGNLTVRGALTVRAHGTIKGSGTLNAPFRFGNSGYISPGLSPGRLVVNGNYEQTAEGRLKIEVGGTAPTVEHDQFVVNGNATLDGTLELRFINGFAPKQGDAFNFLQVSSNLNNGFAAVEIKNLAPGFQFNISTNGTNLSVMALNDGVFVTPLQGQIQSSNVVTVGGISYLPYELAVSDPCTTIELAGGVTRRGQELFQTLSERADPNCAGTGSGLWRILPLGPLPPGSYQFHFMADGVGVYTMPFDVPANTGQVLSFTRTAGGELNLQITGLDSVVYTIQASADFENWLDVPAHVGTFRGPYSIFEPLSAAKARFYRVKIE